MKTGTKKKGSSEKQKRMSSIKSKDTNIEVVLRKALWSEGFRYRKNFAKLPGHPDIVLTKQKIVIFCDSEFFHGKDWEILKPRVQRGHNPEFWCSKIERNMQRDLETDQRLQYLGWTVIHFWGEEILKDVEGCIKVIKETIFENKIGENLEEGNDE